MKKIKQFPVALALISAFLLASGCNGTNDGDSVRVESVSIMRNISITVGEKYTLDATVLPENADNKSVTWESDNSDVATVSASGVVEGISIGEAVVTVKTEDGGKTAECRVTVGGVVTVESVSLDETELRIVVGNSIALRATLFPVNATDTKISWESSAPEIAYYDTATGTVKGLAKGAATITVTTNDGNRTADCLVNVVEPDVWDGLSVTEPEISGNTITIKRASEMIWVGRISHGNITHDDVPETFNGFTVTLAADIDFGAENNWVPIGYSAVAHDGSYFKFEGTIDGNGYYIYNVRLNPNVIARHQGFVMCNAGVIKNLRIESGSASHAIPQIGIGGICGLNEGTIENCVNKIDINGDGMCGGIVGENLGTVKSCINAGNVTSIARTGGICGRVAENGRIENCTNKGRVGNGEVLGGIVAVAEEDSVILECVNSGRVKGRATIGGIVGQTSDNVVISGCRNNELIDGSADKIGGLVGIITGGTVAGCYNTGEVKGKSVVGGLVGSFADGSLSGAFSTGNVTATESAGGVCGEISAGSLGTNYWGGKVMSDKGVGKSSVGEQASVKKFSAEEWPSADASKQWGLVADNGGNAGWMNSSNPVAGGYWWKSLGSFGGGYPALWWE